MSSKKFKALSGLEGKAREEKISELKIELIRKGVTANKANKGKAKEIKKALARLLSIEKNNTQTLKT